VRRASRPAALPALSGVPSRGGGAVKKDRLRRIKESFDFRIHEVRASARRGPRGRRRLHAELAAMRATAPRARALEPPPASRSPSIEAFISCGRPSRGEGLGDEVVGQPHAALLPTSQVSRIVASSSQRMPGPDAPRRSACASPWSWPTAHQQDNFSHSTRTMSSTSSASIFASRSGRNSSAPCAAPRKRAETQPRHLPGLDDHARLGRCGWRYSRASMIAFSESIFFRRSIDSTPFLEWNDESIAADEGTQLRRRSRCPELHRDTTTSDAPAIGGLSTAFTFSCASPSGLFSAGHCAASACRCRPRR